MQELSSGGRGVFAKLSSRSPKDSTVCEARALARVQETLSSMRAAGSALDTNTIFAVTTSCGIQALRCETAFDVLETFLTSERVCEDDLPLALSFPSSWSQHIAVRAWVHVPVHCEVRGFVMNGQLTALSQYFAGVYFPQLVAAKDRVLKMVQRSFTQLMLELLHDGKLADFVIDFAVDLVSDKVYVIELNAFGKPDGMGTGTLLFDKSKASDLAVLFGEEPFEFRVVTAPPETDIRRLLRDGPLKEWLREQGILSGADGVSRRSPEGVLAIL